VLGKRRTTLITQVLPEEIRTQERCFHNTYFHYIYTLLYSFAPLASDHAAGVIAMPAAYPTDNTAVAIDLISGIEMVRTQQKKIPGISSTSHLTTTDLRDAII